MKPPTPAAATSCFVTQTGAIEQLSAEDAADLIRRRATGATDAKIEDLVWVDISHPTEAEAVYLRDRAGMHPLAVEDCMRGRQRPKIDRYPGYFFLVLYAARINPERARMALNEVHLFLGTGFLITVHNQPIAEIGAVLDSWRHNSSRWNQSAAVAHALLDSIVDNYFPLIEYFSAKIEAFEDQIFMEMPEVSMQRVAQIRQELIHFRRILAPERDVLSSFVRRDLPFISPEMSPYFQDVHDHVLRATEEIDAFRDLLAGLLDIQTSNAAKQLNETMRTLTVWSIVLMSMTLVAGIYGMNFARMPELNWPFGYFASLLLMVTIAVVLLGIFRRRRWL